MKRIISTLLVCVLLVGCVFSVVSCSKVSESYAKKINEAADKKEYYTYDQVIEDLGDEAIDFTIAKTGTVMAVKGCESWDDIEEKLEDGKSVKGIVIVMAAGKAMSAEYREISEDDK